MNNRALIRVLILFSVILLIVAGGFGAYAWRQFTYEGRADHVFVGKVLTQAPDQKEGPTLPQTQFVVDVVLNLKGDIHGTVTVNQWGVGYVHGDYQSVYGGSDIVRRSVMNAVKPGESLLQQGVTYLLVTRYVGDNDWYDVYERGIKLISAPKK